MTISERVASLETKMSDFERWQIDQNGTLHELRDKVYSVHKTAFSTFVAVMVALVGIIGNLVIK